MTGKRKERDEIDLENLFDASEEVDNVLNDEEIFFNAFGELSIEDEEVASVASSVSPSMQSLRDSAFVKVINDGGGRILSCLMRSPGQEVSNFQCADDDRVKTMIQDEQEESLLMIWSKGIR
jgi:hypothetical protein